MDTTAGYEQAVRWLSKYVNDDDGDDDNSRVARLD